MNKRYEEDLPFSKGKLVVDEDSFKIQYYFSGPDLRYSGSLITISESEIGEYINAYKQNWTKFQKLKSMEDDLGDNFSTSGVLRMGIRIGLYNEGVCIDSYNMPLKTESEINQIIEAFEWAKDKGPKIIAFLSSIG